jgi:RecB family exonuclease
MRMMTRFKLILNLNEKIEHDIKHLSFSSLKIWCQCPYRYLLDYIYEINKFGGNIHTGLGSAVHGAMEYAYDNIKNGIRYTEDDLMRSYYFNFDKAILESADLPSRNEIMSFRQDGREIVPLVVPHMDIKLPTGYRVHSIEEELYEPINGYDFKFKGYIDLILELPNGKFYIIDWKTSTRGWFRYKRSDFEGTLQQLALYKHFWGTKNDVRMKDIKTAFVILKREAKPDDKVEIFPTYNGPKTLQKAVKNLRNMAYSINKSYYPAKKSERNCKYCPYRGTEHCTMR